MVNIVVNDPVLSEEYKVRGITRDTSSAGARNLSGKGVEMVAADSNDSESLRKAFRGAHTVFAVTVSDTEDTMGSELRQGRNLVDAAISENVQYYIFSTLPNVSNLSGGKYTKVAGFDGKAITEEYIRSLPIKSAFFAPGSFMQNYHTIRKPNKGPDGVFMVAGHVSPQTKLPLIDIANDTGKWIGAILAEPEKFEGKTICAATKIYAMDEQAEILTKATGTKVVYRQLPAEVFKSFLPSSPYTDGLMDMMSHQQDFGYYGEDTEKLVEWAARNARAKVATFEEYLQHNPLILE